MYVADVNKEPDVSKIVREDVLRILGERKRKVSLNFIESRVQVSSSFITETVRALSEKSLVEVEDKYIKLTDKGRIEAEDIVKKHLVFEDFFGEKTTRREAHRRADLFEHYVSKEVVNDLKKLSTLKEEGVPLTEFKLHQQAIITDIFLSDHGLFERLVSMGMFLGEKTTVTNRIPQGVVVKIGNKKFALDRKIAEHVKVVRV